jgi:hypothetical protein
VIASVSSVYLVVKGPDLLKLVGGGG